MNRWTLFLNFNKDDWESRLKVNIKLYGTLSKYCPADPEPSGIEMDVQDNACVIAFSLKAYKCLKPA
jgi:hypothetical protein